MNSPLTSQIQKLISAGPPARARRIAWIALSLALAAIPFNATAQQAGRPANLEEALNRIEALQKQLSELEKFVKEQVPARSGVAANTAPTAAAASTTASSSAAATAAKLPESGFVKWNELTLGKSKFKLYGFLRLDAIYDDSRPNNTQVPSYIRTEDPRALAGASAPFASVRNSDDLTIHPKLTRLGLDFSGPEIEALAGAKTSGKAEIDFYNATATESRSALRMRHAYLKLAWDDVSLLAGQTSDIISPIYPIVNPDFVMWGAGNLGDRRPQLRLEWAPKVGTGNLILQTEAGLTGADDAQDFESVPASAGFRDGEASGKPTLQARVAYALPIFEKQKLEFGVWGHRAWERSDSPLGATRRQVFDSEVVGLDLNIPLYKDLAWLKGEVWTGKNLSDIRGGILQGINVTTGCEVSAQGGWLEVGLRPHKWFSLHGGYTMDNPDDGDLAGTPAPGRSRNSIWYGAVRGYFDPIEIGLDYLNWTTDWVGFGAGVDNRFQGYISYKF